MKTKSLNPWKTWGEKYAHKIAGEIDRLLCEQIFLRERRLPEPEEVAEHGRHLNWPDGRQAWTWKGELILWLEPPTLERHSFRFHV